MKNHHIGVISRSAIIDAGGRDITGVGQKNGIYWAFNLDDSAVIWSIEVGPGGPPGGIECSSAVAVTNLLHRDYPLGKEKQIIKGSA